MQVKNLTALTAVLKREVDMTISYQGGSGNYANFRSDDLKTTIYNELTHAGHYTLMKGSWYNQFVNAKLAEIANNITTKAFSPYGDGTGSNAPIIALGESWAYHMGHVMADRRYGVNFSTQCIEQGIGYVNNSPVNNLSSHINLLEDFSPFRTNDPFHWIPKGLYYDLADTRNEQRTTGGPVDDYVSNYTNQQMFNSFSSSITTLQAYRTRLLNTTTNSTSGSVTNLFQQYGY